MSWELLLILLQPLQSLTVYSSDVLLNLKVFMGIWKVVTTCFQLTTSNVLFLNGPYVFSKNIMTTCFTCPKLCNYQVVVKTRLSKMTSLNQGTIGRHQQDQLIINSWHIIATVSIDMNCNSLYGRAENLQLWPLRFRELAESVATSSFFSWSN